MMTMDQTVLKMSELVRLTGVSKQTIHYYLREGLLLPPVRTSRNMAYYNSSTLDDIRFIKELQEKRYLPLAVIKEVLKARREGYDLGAEDHLLVMDHLFNQVLDSETEQTCDEARFLVDSGVTIEELNQFRSIGIISPCDEGKDLLFNGFDIAIAKALKQLITMGLRLEDLKIYGDFLQFTRIEAQLMHDRIMNRYPDEQHPPLMDIQAGLGRVRSLLTAKAYREFLMSHHHREPINGDNSYD